MIFDDTWNHLKADDIITKSSVLIKKCKKSSWNNQITNKTKMKSVFMFERWKQEEEDIHVWQNVIMREERKWITRGRVCVWDNELEKERKEEKEKLRDCCVIVRNFVCLECYHNNEDWFRVCASVQANVTSSKLSQDFSTSTQQIVEFLFLTSIYEGHEPIILYSQHKNSGLCLSTKQQNMDNVESYFSFVYFTIVLSKFSKCIAWHIKWTLSN
jgi:hypothetical protein